VGRLQLRGCILVSEKLIKNDVFTSVHIEEFELQVRDTKRGVEEITREIPNVSEEAVKNLDEEGVIRTGARVRQGDILVGKVTPKASRAVARGAPAEGDLRRQAGDVRDASLKAPPGMDGIVIDIKVFSRREKDEARRCRKRRRSRSSAASPRRSASASRRAPVECQADPRGAAVKRAEERGQRELLGARAANSRRLPSGTSTSRIWHGIRQAHVGDALALLLGLAAELLDLLLFLHLRALVLLAAREHLDVDDDAVHAGRA